METKKKPIDIEVPTATADAEAIIEQPKASPEKKTKPKKLVRVNPGRLERIRG